MFTLFKDLAVLTLSFAPIHLNNILHRKADSTRRPRINFSPPKVCRYFKPCCWDGDKINTPETQPVLHASHRVCSSLPENGVLVTAVSISIGGISDDKLNSTTLLDYRTHVCTLS